LAEQSGFVPGGGVILLEAVSWLDVTLSFAINVVAAFFVFLVGIFWSRIPKCLRDFRMRRFWGKDLFDGRFALCHGTLQVDRSCSTPRGAAEQTATLPLPFVKIFRDGSKIRISGPSENVMGDSEIRSTAYLVRELSRGLKTTVEIEPDNKAFSRLNGSVVAVGSSGSNEITRLILQEPNNRFFDFAQEEGEEGKVFIYEKETKKKYFGFRTPLAKDYGVVVKLPNLRFPGSFFFVCAGLGDWGTSGAAWFLASNWNSLRTKFANAFGVVVEVDIGSDESARVVSEVPHVG
jgi:hypothetical protein